MTGKNEKGPHVVIVGGGFGGLTAAQELKKMPVKVTLIDRRNFHLFQPLLYQVATGGLSATNIATPLREILKRQKNTTVLLGEVTDINPKNHSIVVNGDQVPYDILIVAGGSQNNYFGHAAWEKWAPGLKSIEDAAEIRRRILVAFEKAERATNPTEREKWLTFVVVGGGPTGVELSGAIAELARDTLKGNFRLINPAEARILLIEASRRILEMYPPTLSEKAVSSLRDLGVEVRLQTSIIDIKSDQVVVQESNGTSLIKSNTVLWTAGVSTSPLSKLLANETGAKTDKKGRLCINGDLSLPGYPDIFIIGDMACFSRKDGSTLPGVAPVAIQQGRYVGKLIKANLKGKRNKFKSFRYSDRGSMTTIGRTKAVADLYWCHLSGPLAWFAWLAVHLIGLVSYENRLLVFFRWAWNYFSRNRNARIITGKFEDHPSPNKYH